MSLSSLPTLNAALNLTAAIFLGFGFYHIKRKNRSTHKKIMLLALAFSALFFISYVIYHSQAGSVPYPKFDWTRPVYFAILVPHIILAVLMTPFILVMVYWALKEQEERHKKTAKWIWPIWMFVSVSGVVVYLMLYQL